MYSSSNKLFPCYEIFSVQNKSVENEKTRILLVSSAKPVNNQFFLLVIKFFLLFCVSSSIAKKSKRNFVGFRQGLIKLYFGFASYFIKRCSNIHMLKANCWVSLMLLMVKLKMGKIFMFSVKFSRI